jgi:pyruvate formate-lyase activating enzyme-like uncharacterized protein
MIDRYTHLRHEEQAEALEKAGLSKVIDEIRFMPQCLNMSFTFHVKLTMLPSIFNLEVKW